MKVYEKSDEISSSVVIAVDTASFEPALSTSGSFDSAPEIGSFDGSNGAGSVMFSDEDGTGSFDSSNDVDSLIGLNGH